jgi:DNA-binding CsgD family transcriptional regulator
MSTPRYGQPLARREIEVLYLTSQGYSYGESARRITPPVSENTVKAHMQHVLIKLGASSAPHAVLLACQAGLLDGRPQRHGDHAGYEAHRRRSETPCEECKAGERAHRSRYKGRQKPSAGVSAPN